MKSILNITRKIKNFFTIVLFFITLSAFAQTSGPAYVKSTLSNDGVFNTPTYAFTSNYDSYRVYSNIKGLFIDGLDYLGKKTKVFCWYGVPSNLVGKAPAVVLVHGGGGDAYPEWVHKWTEKGYIAIAIALEGQVPDKSPTWTFSGPARNGFFGDVDQTLQNQWFYHSVADVILSNSLLRSFPEVDTTNIGITGISWGGIITNVATGIDNRFKFAVPVYGCGFMQYSPTYANVLTGVMKNFYQNNWEPSLYLPLQQQSTLFVNGTNDFHFSMKSFTETYKASPKEKFLRIELNMIHGHQTGWSPIEIYNFADYITKAAEKPVLFTAETKMNNELNYSYDYSGVVDKAIVYYTTAPGNWAGPNYQWLSINAVLSTVNKTVTATLPSNAAAYFVNVVNASKGTMYSSPMKIIDESIYYDWFNYSTAKLITSVSTTVDGIHTAKSINPDKTGMDTSSLVSSFTKTGVNSQLKFALSKNITDLSLFKAKVKVFLDKADLSLVPNKKIRMYLNNSSLGVVGQLYKEVSILSARKWEEYTFDFSAETYPAAVNAAGGYNLCTLMFAPDDNSSIVYYFDALKGTLEQPISEPFYSWFDYSKTVPVTNVKYGFTYGGTFTEKFTVANDAGVTNPQTESGIASKFTKTAGSQIYTAVYYNFTDGSIKDNASIAFNLRALFKPVTTTDINTFDQTSRSVIIYLQDRVGGTNISQAGSNTVYFSSINKWEDFTFTIKSTNLKYYDRLCIMVTPTYASPLSTASVTLNEDLIYYLSSLYANEDINTSTGLEQNASNQDNKVITYPNPVSSILNLNTEVLNSKIYSVSGELMDAYETTKQHFDVSKYSKGLYILQAKLSSGEYSMNYFIKK